MTSNSMVIIDQLLYSLVICVSWLYVPNDIMTNVFVTCLSNTINTVHLFLLRLPVFLYCI